MTRLAAFIHLIHWQKPASIWLAAIGIFINSACATSSAQTIDESSVIIAVVSEQDIYVNKNRVQPEEVTTAVDNRLRLLPEEKRIIYIKALPEVSYGTIVRIIDDLRALGYDRIGLVKDKAKDRTQTAVDSTRRIESDVERENERRRVPKTSTDGDQLIVTVEVASGERIRVRVGQTRVALHALTSIIRARLRTRAEKIVRIIAPAMTKYGSIVKVVDMVKAGGAEQIAFGIK